MSRVTDLVLCLGFADGDGAMGKREEVNRYFPGSGEGLVSVDDPSLPRGWYGGTKYLEARLFIGAYNYLDLDAFIGHLRSIEWESPECVQLLVREQEDERFRLIDVFDSPA